MNLKKWKANNFCNVQYVRLYIYKYKTPNIGAIKLVSIIMVDNIGWISEKCNYLMVG